MLLRAHRANADGYRRKLATCVEDFAWAYFEHRLYEEEEAIAALAASLDGRVADPAIWPRVGLG